MARRSTKSSTFNSSEYINDQRRNYALYVLQSRAIPHAADGLKPAARRVLWVGRNGEKYKTATLAGATMPIHPHDSPDGAINTLAAPYNNNIPLFKGIGAFGTLLEPKEYGAPRYTSVKVSEFTKDVVFRDIEIIPMADNYDMTLQEPVHFLPLVPVALLNPASGIAIGFACNILPRALDDLIMIQLGYLQGKKRFTDPMPRFVATNNVAVSREETNNGSAYTFEGDYEQINATTIRITKLPFGQAHEKKCIARLESLIEKDIVADWTDNSKNVIDIEVRFKKGYLSSQTREDVIKTLGLFERHAENLNVIDFTGTRVWSPTPVDLIKEFTEWRLQWYVQRFERLRQIAQDDLQRYIDIRTAIKNNVSGLVKSTQSRAALKEALTEFKIVNLDYIADLPVYRFTEDEFNKNEERIKETKAIIKEYEAMLGSEDKRRELYVVELKEVLRKYLKGVYNERETQSK